MYDVNNPHYLLYFHLNINMKKFQIKNIIFVPVKIAPKALAELLILVPKF